MSATAQELYPLKPGVSTGTVAAYAFAFEDEARRQASAPRTFGDKACRSGDSAACREDDLRRNGYLQAFKTALDCRNALAVAAPNVQVLITASDAEVSALNLAAALHKDNALRDIYIHCIEPTGLFISRSVAAGARGVVDSRQAQVMLQLPVGDAGVAFGASEDVNVADMATTCSTACPDVHNTSDTACPDVQNTPGTACPDVRNTSGTACPETNILSGNLGWLEDYLELEDLDECEPDAAMQAPAPVGALARADGDSTHTGLGSVSAVLEQQVAAAVVPAKVRVAADNRLDPLLSAFVSGRGGVGKSSLSVLTAVHLLQNGVKVALVDLDLQFGDLDALLGAEPDCRIVRLDIGSVLNGQTQLAASDGELLLVHPPAHPEQAESMVAGVPELFAALRHVAEVVIVNTSCFWNELTAVLAQHCDQLLFTMDQRATSVKACRQAVELCIRLQIPSTRFTYLLNRCSRNSPITSIDASLAVGGAEVASVVDGGREVDEMLSLGLPLELLRSQPSLADSIGGIAALLFGSRLADAPLSASTASRSRGPFKRVWQNRGFGTDTMLGG
jgi:pilus assembly protein CpaE